MENDLEEAQRLLDGQDETIEEQTRLILQLGEEVKTKEALQALLNEQEVKAELKRQNLDVSVSVASLSISDNSRFTGMKKLKPLDANTTFTNEQISIGTPVNLTHTNTTKRSGATEFARGRDHIKINNQSTMQSTDNLFKMPPSPLAVINSNNTNLAGTMENQMRNREASMYGDVIQESEEQKELAGLQLDRNMMIGGQMSGDQ